MSAPTLTTALPREIPTCHGALHARVLFGDVQPGRKRPKYVVWSLTCPGCGRDTDLTGPELAGQMKPGCGTEACHGPPQANYAAAIEQTLSRPEALVAV